MGVKPNGSGVVRFAGFELDLRSGELRLHNTLLKLQPQPAKVLAVLVLRAGELVSRQDLVKEVWDSEVFVNFEQGLNFAIRQIRAVLQDDPENPRFIETVPKRGYRFIATVERPIPAEVAAPPKGSPGAALIGRKVSHYRVLDVVGGGGMGLVYRAEDLRLGRRVALKFLPEDVAGDPMALQRFEREARTASALNHPNICTIYEVEEHEGQPFLVMELLQGDTLRERLSALASAPVPLGELLSIAVQVCDGLQAAHDKGIIHRDIKPANIFLTAQGRVKILDFGLAKFIARSAEVTHRSMETGPVERVRAVSATASHNSSSDHTLTRLGTAMGTAGYMSPEQVRGEKLDARTDLFSFGLVLYEMASGQRAFSGESAAVVRDGILNDEPVPVCKLNSSLPDTLGKAIEKCLAKEREQRYQTAADLRSELELIKQDNELQSGASVRPPSARFKVGRWILAVLLVAMAAGSVFIIERRFTKPRHAPISPQNMRMVRVTDNGNIQAAAISRDGRYIAYSLRQAPYSLWVRQVSSESAVPVVSGATEAIRDVAFSADGSYLYYIRADQGYRIPVAGGTSQLVVDQTMSGIAPSPNGDLIAYFNASDSIDSQLYVASPDGTGKRLVAKHPVSSAVRFHGGSAAPSWSPDGKFIAVVATNMPISDFLDVYPADGGSPRTIGLPSFPTRSIQGPWLTDGSAVLLAMMPMLGAPAQIWAQPFPSGNPQRLTNDLNGYKSLSLTRDGSTLAAVQIEDSYTIFVAPALTPDEGTAIHSGRVDGTGLAWLSAGKLLSQSVESQFALLTPDGKSKVSLFKEIVFPGRFSACGDGHVVFTKDGHIWRTDVAGRDPIQIASGQVYDGAGCSPDSRFVVYSSATGLERVPIEGGVPTILSKDRFLLSARYSPDGRQIATLVELDDSTILKLWDAQTGNLIKSFTLPSGYEPPWGSNGVLRWTADGKALSCILWKGVAGAANIWLQPLNGEPARQITNVPDQIVAYDWSPDGKQIAYTRSAPSRDVVLISNFH